MKHKHEKLIAAWNKDNSTEFEFAYGTGVDFTWHDCDITYVIRNESAQVRVKDSPPKKEKRWIGILDNDFLVDKHFQSEFDLRVFVDKSYAESVARRMIPLEVEI